MSMRMANTRHQNRNRIGLGPPISRLLGPASPFAIIWAIWAIIVNTFDGVVFWARPHVINEGLEVMSPTRAHDNAPATIVFERIYIFIFAPLLSHAPREILSGNYSSRCSSMRSIVNAADFISKASTTFCESLSKALCFDRRFGAAIASAEPVSAFMSRCGWCYNSPASEALSF